MAGGMVLLVTHQGDVALDLIGEQRQEVHLLTQVFIVGPEKPPVVPVFAQLVADCLGRAELLLVAILDTGLCECRLQGILGKALAP